MWSFIDMLLKLNSLDFMFKILATFKSLPAPHLRLIFTRILFEKDLSVDEMSCSVSC